MVIEAPPEMIQAMLEHKGHRKDVDKELKDMTEEGIPYSLTFIEKAVYNCL